MTWETAKLHSIQPCLLGGGWIDIGYLSALRLVKSKAGVGVPFGGWVLQHRFEGNIKTHPITWLVEERSLLAYVLGKIAKKDLVLHG